MTASDSFQSRNRSRVMILVAAVAVAAAGCGPGNLLDSATEMTGGRSALLTLEDMPSGWRINAAPNSNYFGGACSGLAMYRDYAASEGAHFVRNVTGQTASDAWVAHYRFLGAEASLAEEAFIRRLSNCNGQIDEVMSISSQRLEGRPVRSAVSELSVGFETRIPVTVYRTYAEAPNFAGGRFFALTYVGLISEPQGSFGVLELSTIAQSGETQFERAFFEVLRAAVQ